MERRVAAVQVWREGHFCSRKYDMPNGSVNHVLLDNVRSHTERIFGQHALSGIDVYPNQPCQRKKDVQKFTVYVCSTVPAVLSHWGTDVYNY